MRAHIYLFLIASISGCATMPRTQVDAGAAEESAREERCDKNDAEACGSYADSMWATKLSERALLFEKKACSLGEKKICDRNSARTARAMIYKSKCDEGAGAFCTEFAIFSGLDGQDGLGESYLKKGCQLGNKRSCEAEVLYRQLKAKKDLDDAQKDKTSGVAVEMSANAAPIVRLAPPGKQREPAGSVCAPVEVAEIFSGKVTTYRVCKLGWKVPSSDRGE